MKTKNDTINAIQTMVDSAVSKAGYDKTRNAMVIARNSNNTYEIEMDGIKYNNVVFYGSGVLQINEIVKVVIPNNQPSQMCILGKGVVENRKQGTVNGLNSNAFGFKTTASGSSSHAEGYNTTASGNYSHAEGYDTTASKSCSHAEGRETTASGDYSHAEGFQTTASGDFSHAEGDNTKASGMYQHVQGQYNVEDNNNTYADIVGNGEGNSARSNAYALDWNGNGYYKGDVYVGCNADSTGGNKVLTASSLTVQSVQWTGVSCSANNYKQGSQAPPTVAGKTAIGVVGFTSDKEGLVFGYARISGGNVGYRVRNVTSSAISGATITLHVLYV